MARFITVHVRCDWDGCPEIGEEGDGTIIEKTVALDNKQAKAFLLCKPHLDAFETVVLPLMQAGIKVETGNGRTKKSAQTSVAASSPGAAAADAPSPGNGHKDEIFTCRVPDCGRSIKRRTGMAQHVIRTHGFESLDDYEAQYPDSTID
jgi:hypothetical protein